MAALASCGAAAASQASAQTCVGPSSAAQPATAAQHVWAYDFVFDACATIAGYAKKFEEILKESKS
jgi:hypothetical protein